jgi:hypothetical protein
VTSWATVSFPDRPYNRTVPVRFGSSPACEILQSVAQGWRVQVPHPTRRKLKETLWRGKQWFPKESQQQGIWSQCLQVRNSKLEAVKLQVGNRTGSFTAFIWVERFSVENSLYKEKRRNILVNWHGCSTEKVLLKMKKDTLLKIYLALGRKQFFLAFRGSWIQSSEFSQ